MPTFLTFQPAIGAARLLRRGLAAGLRRIGVRHQVTRAHGAWFRVDMADFVDSSIALEGVWEGPQVEILAAAARARNAGLFLDIGANTGFYSIMFATHNLTPRVIAFEPDPGNFARLSANLRINGLEKRIEAVQLALGDAGGEVVLYEGASWNRGESTIAVPEQTPQFVSHRVCQARFDDLHALKGETIVIKIDVEGYEFHTLRGMERTLRDNACLLQIEHYGDEFERLKAVMEGYGYRFLRTVYIDHYFFNDSRLSGA
jgi:FkbM family methyltransferase